MVLSKRYTEEVQRVFKTIKSPYPGLVVDMVEFPKRNYLALRVYKDNLESFSDPQKVSIAEYLYQLRDAVRQCGVQCHIDGALGSPPNRRNK